MPTMPPMSGGMPQMGNINPEQVKQQMDAIKGMSDDQLNMISSMYKNMDNDTLKSMMKQQSGMEMSDAQLNQMKMMMTPEMLKMRANIDPNTIS